jgi:cytochrome c peroxidase
MAKGRIILTASSLLFLAGAGGVGFALGAGAEAIVSQKDRAFSPNAVELALSDTLIIHNDDQFVHDVLVNSPNFSFDSGEQGIGQNVQIKFPAAGHYRVTCAIHPKMRLEVEVK